MAVPKKKRSYNKCKQRRLSAYKKTFKYQKTKN